MVKRRRIKKRRPREPEKRNLTFILFAVVIFVGSILGYALLSGGSLNLGGGILGEEEPGRRVPILGNQHVQPGEEHMSYNSDPPTSGPHYTSMARWGVHSEPIPKELQVHNLEDGGVIVQYNCMSLDRGTCDELVRNLSEVVIKYERTILAPYPDMDNVIALTAWGRIDKFKEFEEERVVKFIEAYIGIDHHPQ